MKVLMIAPQPFFEPRGTPISVYQRLHGLSELGYEVDLVTYPIGNDVKIPGVTIHRSPELPFIKKVRIGPSFAKIPLDIMLFFMSIWMLLTRRYDIIHSHEEAAFFSVILSKIFNVPHLYDMHSSLPKQLQNFGFGNHPIFINLFDVLEKWVLRTCDVVLTIGSDLEEFVLETNKKANHIRIENVAVHSNTQQDGAAIDEMRKDLNLNGRLPIVYTGTFEKYQGLDLLLKSLHLIVQSHPDISLIMAGGNPEQVAERQRQVEHMGVADYITFVGTVPLEESLRYLEMAEILVSPRTEGLSVPLKIYSYLSSGKPMVATDIFAHTQVLTEKIAVITDLTPEAYAAGITYLIENAELREQIGAAAKKHADEHYSTRSYLMKLEKAYLSIRLSKRICDITKPELSTATA